MPTYPAKCDRCGVVLGEVVTDRILDASFMGGQVCSRCDFLVKDPPIPVSSNKGTIGSTVFIRIPGAQAPVAFGGALTKDGDTLALVSGVEATSVTPGTDPDHLVVVVPDGATTGVLTVTVDGVVTMASYFIVE